MTAMAATRQPILLKPSVLLTVLKEQLHIQHVQLRSSDSFPCLYCCFVAPATAEVVLCMNEFLFSQSCFCLNK